MLLVHEACSRIGREERCSLFKFKCRAFDRGVENVIPKQTVVGAVVIHVGVRVARHERDEEAADEREEGQGFEWVVEFAGAQVRVLENLRGNRVHFGRRGRRRSREVVQPKRDVIAMGVEVLHRVSQFSKGFPCRVDVTVFKRCADDATLFLDVGVRGVEHIAIKMKVIMTELIMQAILCEIGAHDSLQRVRADMRLQRLCCDTAMVLRFHSVIIRDTLVE